MDGRGNVTQPAGSLKFVPHIILLLTGCFQK